MSCLCGVQRSDCDDSTYKCTALSISQNGEFGSPIDAVTRCVDPMLFTIGFRYQTGRALEQTPASTCTSLTTKNACCSTGICEYCDSLATQCQPPASCLVSSCKPDIPTATTSPQQPFTSSQFTPPITPGLPPVETTYFTTQGYITQGVNQFLLFAF